MPENADNFCCDICDFICSKQSNYAKHLMTRKHKNMSKILTNTYILASKNAENVENVDNSEITNNTLPLADGCNDVKWNKVVGVAPSLQNSLVLTNWQVN